VDTVARSLVNFVRSQIDEDEEDKHVWFHLSAGLGMHASMPITNTTTKKDETHKIALLRLDPVITKREHIHWSWSWAGKIFATLFAMTQAVGTIIIWVRRIDNGNVSTLGFDHRNGAMGIASTICSVGSIFILLLRYDWSVPRALQSSSTERLHTSGTTLVLHTFLAITLHHWIAWLANDNNNWLYTSSGLALLVSRVGTSREILGVWQSILLVIFIVIFRKDIADRIGVNSSRYQAWVRHQSWKRMKALLKIPLVLWFVADILRLFIQEIIEIIQVRDYESFWWQDPISDRIFVI